MIADCMQFHHLQWFLTANGSHPDLNQILKFHADYYT